MLPEFGKSLLNQSQHSKLSPIHKNNIYILIVLSSNFGGSPQLFLKGNALIGMKINTSIYIRQLNKFILFYYIHLMNKSLQ